MCACDSVRMCYNTIQDDRCELILPVSIQRIILTVAPVNDPSEGAPHDPIDQGDNLKPFFNEED